MLEKKEEATQKNETTTETTTNVQTTRIMTKRNITIAALLALILAISGVMMVFSSNNMENQNGKVASEERVSAIGESDGTTSNGEKKVGGLDYYENTVDNETTTEDGQKKVTITNKYIGPIISAEKEVKTATEVGYVVEGEEIEYTIIAKNDGGVAKDVVIKDPIVDGIEFVPGTIKVNGSSTYILGTETIDLTAKGETDLTNGITVNVPAKSGETTGIIKLSFKAKIKDLVGADLVALQKTIVNTATVDDEEATETVVVKKSDVKSGKTATIKKAVATRAGEESTKTVEKNDEITYTITVTNDGEAKAEVNVQDTAPEGTTYVENTTKIVNKDGTESTLNMTDLATGITIEVEAHDEKKVIFTVRVNDIENDTIIKNVATVNEDKPEVEYTYIEPVVDVVKTVTKEDGNEIKNPNYVLEGQTIVYRITVTNEGSKETDAIVTDIIPTGLSIVPESIIVDLEETIYTSADLASGITVNVPAKGKNEEGTVVAGQTIVEFKVTVDELAEGVLTQTLKNIAVVTENDKTHQDDVDVTINKPDLHVNKSVNPGEGTKVKAGDEITYTITLDNSTGTAPTTAKVKDSAPKGTSFKGVASVMKDTTEETTKTEAQLSEGFDVELAAFESKTVVFTVVVGNKADATEEEKVVDGEMISNTANVNGENTNTTETHYIEPIITSKKEVTTENGLGYVVKNEKVSYKITVENAGGLAKEVTIQDTISEKLALVDGSLVVRVNGVENTEVAKDLAAGIVVTVPEKVGEANGTVVVTFDTKVKETASGEITNVAVVDGTNTPSDKLPVLTFNKKAEIIRTTQGTQTIADGKVTTNDEIKYTIKVTNSGEETARSIEIKDRVPDGTRLKENSITENGQVVDGKDITWTVTDLETGTSKEVSFTIVVNYSEKDITLRNTAYVAEEPTNEVPTDYEKPDGRVADTITKTGTENITKEDAEVTYDVKYETKVNDYVGDAEVTVVDTLPYAIDEAKSDLAGGTYDAETKTITWTSTVTGIDTYTNGERKITVEKTIKVVFVNMDYSKTTFANTVVGKTTLKYLEDEEPVTFPEKDATVETITNFRTSVEVEKKWNHTNNIYGNPESVTIELLADGAVVQEATLTMANKVGNDAETWTYTFTGLTKYAEDGHRIIYTVREK